MSEQHAHDSGPARRRNAPSAETSSDVTRFRGLGLAGALAFAIALAVVILSSGSAALRGAPGPLSWPHERAGISCAACHERAGAARDACIGCHGAREHTRAGHAGLARSGDLPCAHCHAVHRDHGGAVFEPDGSAYRFFPGMDILVQSATSEQSGPTSWYRPPARVIVPVIPARACASCHDLDNPVDPAAACVLAARPDLGLLRPTLCLDEHRSIGSTSRDSAWQAARDLASAVPAPPARRGPGLGPLVWVFGAVLASLVFWLVPRALVRARRRAAERTAHGRDTTVAPPRERKLPTINTSTCIGCYACVDACPYDVLEVHSYLAVVMRPADCCGLTLCEQRCPNGSLIMGDGQPVTGSPRVSDALESQDQPGIYLAGDVTGLPLIRNAINQGAYAARAAAADLAGMSGKQRAHAKPDQAAGQVVHDLIIIGAGPAGLAAALAAADAGLSYLVLEQSTVAASIRGFPRGKLVFDQPLELPMIGDLWLEQSTKEELLAQWLRIVRKHQLAIREHTRVARIARMSVGVPTDDQPAAASASHERTRMRFQVHALDRDGVEIALAARRIIVAIGRRGSPRRLDIELPAALEDRVFYSLADARTFAGRRVLIVGLGDVAMEAALALSEQPDTHVVVSYRGLDFRRGKARTIDALKRRAAAGAVELLFDTEVRALEPGRALLGPAHAGKQGTADDSDELIDVPCDVIFVLIGSIPPVELLSAFGLTTPERAEAS